MKVKGRVLRPRAARDKGGKEGGWGHGAVSEVTKRFESFGQSGGCAGVIRWTPLTVPSQLGPLPGWGRWAPRGAQAQALTVEGGQGHGRLGAEVIVLVV